MKAWMLALPLLLLAVWCLAPRLVPARAEPDTGGVAYEVKHLLIPLDRNLETYEKSDVKLLEPVQRLGSEGWALVSVSEPGGGLMVQGRASVEFWFQRAYTPTRR